MTSPLYDAGDEDDASSCFRAALASALLPFLRARAWYGTVELPLAFEERTHWFVVSIWWERREDPDSEPIWRGYVQYERTGKRIYFRDSDTVVRFLEESAGIPRPAYRRWRRRLMDFIRRKIASCRGRSSTPET